VIPGRTCSTDLHEGWLKSTNSGSSGLGPTRLIWPHTTFHNCGSSSNLYFRKTLPTPVMRGSLLAVIEHPLVARMLRIFRRRNSFPSRPTRVCENKMGQPVSTNTANAIRSRTGDKTNSASAEPQASATSLVHEELILRTLLSLLGDTELTTLVLAFEIWRGDRRDLHGLIVVWRRIVLIRSVTAHVLEVPSIQYRAQDTYAVLGQAALSRERGVPAGSARTEHQDDGIR